MYAVDVSVWDHCDTENSPQRVYYYQPSRHSAGQLIVAGWAYQFIVRLNFVRESQSAPWTWSASVPRGRQRCGRRAGDSVSPAVALGG